MEIFRIKWFAKNLNDENNKIIFEPRYKSKSVGFYRNDNLKILLDELEKLNKIEVRGRLYLIKIFLLNYLKRKKWT